MNISEGIAVSAGYSPLEISALLNLPILEDHATDAAFLWRLRERALLAAHYKLPQLAALDARVLAHLEGLRIAGAAGIDIARRNLSEIERGAVFVAAYLAFAANDQQFVRNIVSVALTDPLLADALIAALSWLDLNTTDGILNLLSRSSKPEYRRMSLCVYGAHRVYPGPLLERSADDPDDALRARALRGIGELGRVELSEALRRGLSDPNGKCRFWAAWSLALFGEPHAGPMAYEQGIDDPDLTRMAIDVAMRTCEPQWGRSLIRALAKDGETLRRGAIAAGSFGEAAVIPWLLDLTEDKDIARAASEAFAMITGLELERSDVKRDAPMEPLVEHLDDDGLRWPNTECIRKWWKSEQFRFQSGGRYLAGLLITESSAFYVLRTGYQRQRRGAAIELALLSKGQPFFPLSMRAALQQRRLPA